MGKSWKSRKSGPKKGQHFLGKDRQESTRVRDHNWKRGNPLPRDLFEKKLLEVLGKSHEAVEMTEADFKDMYNDYLDSGERFYVWVKKFER